MRRRVPSTPPSLRPPMIKENTSTTNFVTRHPVQVILKLVFLILCYNNTATCNFFFPGPVRGPALKRSKIIYFQFIKRQLVRVVE